MIRSGTCKGFLPSKPLRKFSQAVHGVEVRALAVSGQRFAVELYSVYGLDARLVEVTEKTRNKYFIMEALGRSSRHTRPCPLTRRCRRGRARDR